MTDTVKGALAIKWLHGALLVTISQGVAQLGDEHEMEVGSSVGKSNKDARQ